VAEEEKPFDQLILLAMSVCIAMSVCLYVQDLTNRREKDKRHHDSLLLSERAPPDWGLHPELATMVDMKGSSAENA
jgi:hypothetical protein